MLKGRNTTNLVNKTNYDTKISEIENKTSNTTYLATNTIPNSKF